jgi:hypothetical protein
VLYGLAFVVLLAGAIGGGLLFGTSMRTPAPAPVAASAPPPPAASSAPASTGKSHTLDLPAVEISGP